MQNSSILVFVVEDEQILRDLLEETLQEAGFTVLLAHSAEEAFKILEDGTADHRALVTDVNLARGRATGWDVARRARELKPELPVVYMTGGEAHDWASRGVPNSVLVAKPFVPAQVITAVSQLLNAASTLGGQATSPSP